MTDDLETSARAVLQACERRGWMAATAESCTGGMVAAALTAIAGSSSVVDRGFVTYSNRAKTEMLGVPAALIAAHGAVSEEVARAMAQGALDHSVAHLAVAITGIAGPGGGGPDKPVGLVHFACAVRGEPATTQHLVFAGDREAVRRQAALTALAMMGRAASQP